MSIQGITDGAWNNTNSVTSGIDKIYAYDNISIVVLMVMVLLLLIANGVQFRAYGKRLDKGFDRDIIMAKAINSLESAVDEMIRLLNFSIQIYKGKDKE